MRTILAAAVAALTAFGLGAPASAAFQLFNSPGAYGSVMPIGPTNFVIIGSDDNGCDCDSLSAGSLAVPALPNFYTAYFTTAATDLAINVAFTYLTFDDYSYYDPAGYLIDGALFQVTPDDIEYGEFYTGRFQFEVLAGQVYGYWVGSTDNAGGAAVLAVGNVPEPATWLLMIGGFGLVGGTLRRQRQVGGTLRRQRMAAAA